MKNKLLSAMLVCLLFVNACNINNIYDAKISNTVPDTAVYFEGKQIVLADKYKTSKEYSFAVIRTEFLNENYIAVMIHAEGVASTNIRSEDYIEIYDYSGELNQQIDLHSFGKGVSFTGACIGQTETGMCVLLANNKSSNITIYEVDKDFEEWNKQISITLSSIKTGFSPKKIYKLGKEYLIIYDWLEGDYYKTGVLRIDDLGKTKGDWQINSNDAISNIDLWGNKLVYRDENNNDFRTLDISSGKCQRIPISDNQYSILYLYLKSILPSGDVRDLRLSPQELNYILFEQLQEYEKKFGQYINAIQKAKPDYISTADNLINHMIDNENDKLAYINSFNYSDLTSIYKDVWHINGDVDMPIFGVDYPNTKPCDMNKYRYTKTYRRLELTGKETYYPRKKDYTKIIVYGHSLNRQDYSYFFALFNMLDLKNDRSSTKRSYYIEFVYSKYGAKTSKEVREELIARVLNMFYAYNKEVLNESNFRLIDILFTTGAIRFKEI